VRCDLIQKLVTSMGDQHVVVLTLGAGGCRAPEPDLDAFVIPAVSQVVIPPAGLEAEGDTRPADPLVNASPDASTTPEDDEEGEDGDDDADMLDVEDAASAEAAAQLRAAAARAAQADAATAGETTAPSLTPPASASSVAAPLTEPPTPEEEVVSCPNYDWVSVADVPSLVSTLQSLAADRTVDYVLVDGGRAEGTSTEPHILARTLVEQCGRVVAIDALVVALNGVQALGDLNAPHSDAEAAAAAAAAVEAETAALDAGAGLQDDVSRAMRFVKLVEHANVIVVVGEATTAGGGEAGAGLGTAPAVEDRPASGRESLTQQLAVVLTALNAEARVVHTLGPTVNPSALVRTGLYGSSAGVLPMWKRILASCDGEGRPLSAVVGADGRPGESSSGKGSSAAESGGRAAANGKNVRGSNGVTGGTVTVRANGGGEEASGTVARPALPRAAREATFVFRAKRPFHPARLYDQIKVMTTFAGVLRSTGKLWLATRMAKPLEWNQAGDTATVRLGRPFLASVPEELWREEDRAALADVRWDERWGDRETVLVFVGVRMDKAKLQGLLDSCLLQDEEMVFDHAWQSLSDPFVQWVPLATDDDDEEEEEEDEDDEDLGSSAPAQPDDGPPETFNLQPAAETSSLQPTDSSVAGAAAATSTTAAVAAASMAAAATEEPRSASGEIAAATELAASVATEPAAAAAAPLVDPVPTVETVPLVQTASPVDAPPPPSPAPPAAAEVAAAESADAAPATGAAKPGDGAAAPAGEVAVNGVAANAVGTPADMTEPPARPDATLTTVTEAAPGGAPAPAVPDSPVAGPAVEGAVPATSGDAPLYETAWEAEWAAQEEVTGTAASASTAPPPAPSSASAPAQAPVEPPPPPPPLPTPPPPRPPPRQPPQAAAAPPVAPPAPPPEPANYPSPSPSPPPGASSETPPPTDCGGS